MNNNFNPSVDMTTDEYNQYMSDIEMMSTVKSISSKALSNIVNDLKNAILCGQNQVDKTWTTQWLFPGLTKTGKIDPKAYMADTNPEPCSGTSPVGLRRVWDPRFYDHDPTKNWMIPHVYQQCGGTCILYSCMF